MLDTEFIHDELVDVLAELENLQFHHSVIDAEMNVYMRVAKMLEVIDDHNTARPRTATSTTKRPR